MAKAADIKLIVSDVDGVWTDGRIIYAGERGESKEFHVRDGLVNNGKVETAALDPIARIAGPRYARLGEIVTLNTVFQTSKSPGEGTS